jgi:glucokinase
MDSSAVLGVDVGGTFIKTWRVDAAGGRAGGTVPTPRGDADGSRTAALVAELIGAAGADAAGLAVPGIVDDAAGVCRRSVNLGWRDVPIGALVEQRAGVAVAVTHDVRAAATAERTTGAGAGRPGRLLLAPAGTGLAIAVVDERGLPVADGWAGEVGQLRYPAGPHRGLRVEEVASAGGLAARYGVPEAVEVLRAMERGDERAARLWGETVDALAEVLAWGIAVADPRTVVVGGGLARAGEALLAPLRVALDARVGDFFPHADLLPALHGTDAAAIGAARLAATREG